MTTANALIADALGSIGVIGSADTVGGNDAVTSLRVLNRMIDNWRLQPNLATHSTWVQFTLPASTQTRTIGPTGQVVTTRPTTLEIGSFVRFQGIDYPLNIAERDQYAASDLKSEAGSWPRAVYYEASAPNGTLYFWPLAGSGVEVFLAVRSPLTKFADLTTDYTLPDGYEAAIVPSLAIRLAPVFERPVSGDLREEARSARAALKRTNAKVPTLDVTGEIPGRSRLGDFLGGALMVAFVGGSYTLDTRTADVQRVVNMYVTPIESGTGKAAFMLKSIPGLSVFAALGSVGRGAYEINGRAWVVVDDKLFELAADGTATDRGTLFGATGYVSMSSNTTQLFMVDNGRGYVLDLATNAFAEIIDADFPGGYLTDYLDQYAIFAPADGQAFYISALGDASGVDALDFASAEASPDNLAGFRVINRQLWLLGSATGEVWFNTGSPEFPIERNNGAIFGVGCSARWSIQPFNGTIAWLGADKAGGDGVWMAAGYQAQRISNRCVEQAISDCTDLNAALAYVQRIDGSVFYCLQLPGVNTTWCFDAMTGQWSERAELVAGEYQRHRVSWYFKAFGKNLGLGSDGTVYEWDATLRTNAGEPLVRDRITPHNATPSNNTLYFSDFKLDLDTGFEGVVMLRYSNDGGATWGAWDQRTLGGDGSRSTRVRWLRCGSAKDRVWHVRCTDAVPFNPVNATMTVAP